MGIRDSREFGENLVKIAKYLLDNQNLCKLLINTSADPLSTADIQDTSELLNKNMLVVPYVRDEDTESKVVILFNRADVDDRNTEFKDCTLTVLVYTPLSKWIINDAALRPFLIISEIEQSLKNKRINGIGTIRYSGFELDGLTDITSCYKLSFTIDVFN